MAIVLVTDHGDHTPDKWAVATASMIFPAETAGKDKLMAAKRFELKLAEVLEGHHGSHQGGENSKIGSDAAHVNSPCNPVDEADAALADVVAASKGTEFEEYCARPEWQTLAHEVILAHFTTVSHNARSWHADKHPNCPHGQKYRENHHNVLGAAPVAVEEADTSVV